MQTIEAIQRVRDLVAIRPDWFDAICQWYRYAHLTRRVFEEFIRLDEVRENVSIGINGRHLANLPEEMSRSGDLHWRLPANMLFPGDNNITVSLGRNAKAALLCHAVTALQEGKMPQQIVDLRERQPAPARHMVLGYHEHAHHQGHHWAVQPGGQFLFRLHLNEIGPVHFSVRLASDRVSLLLDWLEEIMKQVEKAVEHKRRELEERRRSATQNGSKSLPRVEQDLIALMVYQQLHEEHLRVAIISDPECSLQQVIDTTRPPRQIIHAATAKIGRAKPAATGGAAGYLILVVLVLVAGVIGYNVWAENNFALPRWVQNLQGNEKPKRRAQNQARPPRRVQPPPPPARNQPVNRDMEQVLRARGAKTGAMEISLFWNNKNDLDLHVVCPTKNELYYGRQKSKCGGRFQFDMNVNYDKASTQPAEHIYWPNGTRPRGKYTVYVRHFRNHGKRDCQDPTRFLVRVKRGGRVQYYRGEVVRNDRRRSKQIVCEFVMR